MYSIASAYTKIGPTNLLAYLKNFKTEINGLFNFELCIQLFSGKTTIYKNSYLVCISYFNTIDGSKSFPVEISFTELSLVQLC